MSKKKISVSEILRKSLKEIEAGYWVCGELCRIPEDGPKGKPMACAVGMVSLYSGNTKKERFYVGEYKSGPRKGEDKFVAFTRATYPDKKWTEEGVKALEILTLTAPTKAHKMYPRIPSLLKRGEPVAQDLLGESVVSANDEFITSSRNAAAWFKRALKLAEKKGL